MKNPDFLNVCGLEFGFDILLPDCGLPPLDWIVNQVLAITFLCKNISASRKENEHILSNFCVCNIMVQSHWSKSQAVTLTSTTIRDLIVELDWTERSLRMLDLIAELIVSSLEWTGEKNWT